MWKEKYEALKTEFDQLRDAHDRMARKMGAMEKLLDNHGLLIDPSYTVETVDGSKIPPQAQVGLVNGNLDSVYRYIVDRAAKEPALLNLLVDRPELMVKVERRMINSSDASTQGRIALLLYEKFFDTAKDAGDVTREFKRRGWFDAKASNAALIKPLAQITEWGFLTKEDAGYQAVSGMKVNINIVEARA